MTDLPLNMGSRTARYTIAENEQAIEPVRQFIIQCHRRRTQYTYIFAFFDKAELMDSVPNNGRVEVYIVGRLTTGQFFYYGTYTVWTRRPRQKPWPRWRRW